MPFSLEEQLKLFDPRRFEELCAQLVKREFPQSWHVEGAGGDEGIDIFVGELDKKRREQTGSLLRVWQVKLFREGMKHGQREKAEKSLERVKQMHQPDCWTLCIPINLNMDARRWVESLRLKYPDIALDIWRGDDIVYRVRQDKSLIDSYFLRPQPVISKETLKPILDRLDDFESVPELLENARPYVKDASDFYNGTIPDWRDIVQNFDAPREQFGKLWQIIAKHANNPGGRVPFVLITGRSGDGKSTVLMRLATELVKQGCELVFYCKDDTQSLHAEQFSELPKDKVSFVFIDRITRFDVDNLRSFFERLYREAITVVVIGAAVRSLWEGLSPALENVTDVCVVGLEEMSDNDIDALLDKLGADPDHAVEYLGALAGLPREQQVALFRQKARRQLLVALIEAKHNRAFKDYVYGELSSLENHFGRDVRRACIYISAVHRLDLSMPRNLLQRLLPNTFLDDDVLRRTHGLLVELLLKRTGIATRHALIAEVIFNSEPRRQHCYAEIITTADVEQERLIGRTLHALTLRGENALADMLFRVASQRFPHNVVLNQMHAKLTWKQGDIKRARELFEKGTRADPKNVHTWQAWALMEKDAGNINKARELFDKGTQANPKDAYTWQAWALMEKDAGEIEKARALFQKGTEADPKSVPTWQAWALMEKDAGEIEKARALFQKGTEADPKSVPTWQAWAGMEKKQRYWAQAEQLYLHAAEADFDNISRARTYFDLAMMFANLNLREKEEKYLMLAIDSNPNDHIVYARLGRTYSFQNEWEKAEHHFQRSLQLKPDDRKTQQWYAKMQQARERFGKIIYDKETKTSGKANN
jgi:tetratricopeptide (TPR) repeat protein